MYAHMRCNILVRPPPPITSFPKSSIPNPSNPYLTLIPIHPVVTWRSSKVGLSPTNPCPLGELIDQQDVGLERYVALDDYLGCGGGGGTWVSMGTHCHMAKWNVNI